MGHLLAVPVVCQTVTYVPGLKCYRCARTVPRETYHALQLGPSASGAALACLAPVKRALSCRTIRVYYERVHFEIVGEIRYVEAFARGSGIRELQRLRRQYGLDRWRKRKGYATVRLPDGSIQKAEIHWYEASGIGKREFKIKRYVD
jgi:hypothetical protein